MQFTQIEVTASGTDYVYRPYDRGNAGAFVWRQNGDSVVHAPRLVVSTKTDDNASDKYVVQSNIPRTCSVPNEDCVTEKLLGTDLVKTEMRFLASTKLSDRYDAISLHIALLQELRDMVQHRDVIYS